MADGVRAALLGGPGRQELKEPQMVVFIDKGRRPASRRATSSSCGAARGACPTATLRVDEVMATLQIVHVRERTATARVLNVMSPDIPPGTEVLQVAKLPA